MPSKSANFLWPLSAIDIQADLKGVLLSDFSGPETAQKIIGIFRQLGLELKEAAGAKFRICEQSISTKGVIIRKVSVS